MVTNGNNFSVGNSILFVNVNIISQGQRFAYCCILSSSFSLSFLLDNCSLINCFVCDVDVFVVVAMQLTLSDCHHFC